MSQLIKDITNEDIIWDSNFAGLSPTITGKAAKQLLEQEQDPIPDLLPALSDQNRFVAAHVIITQRSGINGEIFPTWNGLAVDIAADGTVTIPSDQRHSLARRWKRWYQTTPHPEELPDED